MGYWEAGFEVVGVDINPQPRYPFELVRSDVRSLPDDFLGGFDVIHASPPCQRYSVATAALRASGREYPDLVAPVRERLQQWGGSYVIENVPGAPLENPVQLCGSAFGLRVRRHRLFESNVFLSGPPACDHGWQRPRYRRMATTKKRAETAGLSGVVGVYKHTDYKGEGRLREIAMGIDWMTQDELAEAIPPAYTRWIGRKLMDAPSLLLRVG